MSDNQNKMLMAIQQQQPLRFELVEVYIDAGQVNQSKFTFPTDNNLQGRRVLYVDAYSVETMSISPTGRTVISVATFLKSSLTMYTTLMQKQNIQNIPFAALNPYQITGGTAPNAQTRILLNNPQTDWNKCIIDTGTPIGVSGVSFCLGVFYVDQ